MLSLNCAWINDWVNNREAGDFRRHCTHYDVTVMLTLCALGSVSICNKTSYCKILQGLEAVRFVFESVRSLRNLTGTSAAVLPVSLFNFNWFKFSISLLRDFTRSYDNTAYCILKRGPWHYRNGRNHSGHDRPKGQVTLCRLFFADVPEHSRPPRSVMIVTKPSDRGRNSQSLSLQDCRYDLSTTTLVRWMCLIRS